MAKEDGTTTKLKKLMISKSSSLTKMQNVSLFLMPVSGKRLKLKLLLKKELLRKKMPKLQAMQLKKLKIQLRNQLLVI